jgi:hypothetical protein
MAVPGIFMRTGGAVFDQRKGLGKKEPEMGQKEADLF